ncbi:hypothetical protein [Corynebacterium nasicanis]|uniref:Secreted protein n=1 Tax=Corynebacterium nasicanis TaxID=1448267 RepID=A0ABW1QDT8_9CORY
MSGPLRRTRGDLIASAAITGVSLLAVAGVWASAPIRSSELIPAESEFTSPAPLDTVPQTLTEAWSAPTLDLPGVHRPVIVDGLVAVPEEQAVRGVDPTTGETVWSYTRDLELCSLGGAWGRVVTTWRAGNGCGDVVSIDAETGRYHRTRSAISPGEVAAVTSNDRVGTIGAERLELWRSDLVRTVEYGEVEGIQEPDLQPHPGCRLTSALTRSDLLAVTENCEDGTWLRLQEASPEQSREPEIRSSVQLDSPTARLVALGGSAAAVADGPALISYSDEGVELHRREAGTTAAEEGLFSPVTADLPHHMSWFDGERLVLFSPAELEVRHVFEQALGTGVAVGGRLLLPVEGGIAVIDWENGETLHTIPVDRGEYRGTVTLGVAGETVVEKRGNTLHALR